MHVKRRGKIAVGKFRKKPLVVDAIRYGKDEDGRWYPGCVQRVAGFMLNMSPDATITQATVGSVLEPEELWDPENGHADLLLWDGVAHNEWLPLALGDWVVRGVKGEHYPCKPDIFKETYEPVEN